MRAFLNAPGGAKSMKVAYLTAGAGGMYCGSCMRDNTLAAALLRSGRDVVLIPIYSPIRTDEADVSQACVFYGGINIFLQQRSGLFRHTPRLFDRLLDYPPLLRRAMKSAGATTPSDVTPLIVSILQGETGAQRKELARLIDGLAELGAELVHLPNALFVGLARRITEVLGVPVVCTLTGEDIFIDKLPESAQSEVVELIRSNAVIAEGAGAVALAAARKVPEEGLTIVAVISGGNIGGDVVGDLIRRYG